MSVTVRIPSYLAGLADGRNSIIVTGAPATTAGVLQSLWNLHPALRDRVLDEKGEVRQHINIFVDNECIRFDKGLATRVRDGAEILIVPAVSGG